MTWIQRQPTVTNRKTQSAKPNHLPWISHSFSLSIYLCFSLLLPFSRCLSCSDLNRAGKCVSVERRLSVLTWAGTHTLRCANRYSLSLSCPFRSGRGEVFVVPAHNLPLTYTSNMDRQEIERQREKERWAGEKREIEGGKEWERDS